MAMARIDNPKERLAEFCRKNGIKNLSLFVDMLSKALWNSWGLMICLLFIGGCATDQQIVKNMEVTGYCGCGKCCNWERGSWKYLKLNFWNRYINAGPEKGKPYSGLTASGTKPHEPHPGLFSLDSLKKPWMIPIRIIFFPWLFLSKDGTLAADTRYYPFGTRIYVPGYGYGVVEDRGGAITGRFRLDAYFRSHGKALKWGRQQLTVTIDQ